jgi:hypothetical protein
MYQRLVVGLLWLCATPATAQVVDFPVQPAKTPEAKSAGIGSYGLTREGEIVAVEAFDLAGEPLANCEVQWLEDSKVMTCTMMNGQRFRATWYQERAELEDLVTGDHISLHKEGPSLREIMEMAPEARPEHEGWVVGGTKAWQEVERDWGHITPILGSLLGEIEITLGIPAERLSSIQ